MRKLIVTTALACAAMIGAFAQVGIGTNNPNTSSVLELNSTDKAFLPPRMTTVQRDLIPSPVAGMVIFNTSTNCLEFYRSTGWYNVCGGGLPPIDGFNNSNEVAADSLLAHWSFDDTKNERISGVPVEKSIGTSAFSSGQIGKAVDLTAGGFVYPPIPNLNTINAIPSYTISMWVKIAPGRTDGAYTSLFQINGTKYADLWGLAAVNLKTNGDNGLGYGGDTLVIGGRNTQIDGHDPYIHGQEFQLTPRTTPSETFKGANKWSFIVQSYDGPTQTIRLYADGVLKATRVLTTVTSPETFLLNPFGGDNKVTIGTFAFFDDGFTAGDGFSHFAPTSASRPWAAHGIDASLDDIRVFKCALSQAKITALFNLGKAGR